MPAVRVRPCVSDHNAHERTYVCERATVDDQYESTGALAVVVSDERGHPSINALEWVTGRLLLLRLVQTDPVLLQDAALREELLDSVEHLHVDRGSALASAANDDDVVVAADEVRAVTNRDGGLELVSGEDPNLDVGLLQVSDRLGDAVLQTILDSSRAE